MRASRTLTPCSPGNSTRSCTTQNFRSSRARGGGCTIWCRTARPAPCSNCGCSTSLSKISSEIWNGRPNSTRARSLKRSMRKNTVPLAGHRFSALIGDYEFGRHPQDMALLEKSLTSPPRPMPRSLPRPARLCLTWTVLPSWACHATWPRSSTRWSMPSGSPSESRKTRATWD